MNGVLEHGIAVGVDPELDGKLKIPILHSKSRAEAATYAAIWAHKKAPAAIRNFAAAAAAGVINAGFCSPDDGDSIKIDTEDATLTVYAKENKADIIAACTPRAQTSAVTTVLATKINWFQTNHQTGQSRDKIDGDPSKVYKAGVDDNIDEEVVTWVHTAGHWASTKRVLGSVGFPFVASGDEKDEGRDFNDVPKDYWGDNKVTEAIAGEEKEVLFKVALSPDARMRVESNPAALQMSSWLRPQLTIS